MKKEDKKDLKVMFTYLSGAFLAFPVWVFGLSNNFITEWIIPSILALVMAFFSIFLIYSLWTKFEFIYGYFKNKIWKK